MQLWETQESVMREAALGEGQAWLLLRALAARAGLGEAVTKPRGVRVDGAGWLEEVGLGQGWLDLYPDAEPPFRPTTLLPPSVKRLLDLYLPLCIGDGSSDLVIGHLAQSLDGQIATSTGASCYITGQEDLVHTHRLRALFDVVLVGRATITSDDPRLTTRLVPGRSPARVVLDPGMRAPEDRRVFRDGASATLLFCASPNRNGRRVSDHVEIIEIASSASGAVLPPVEILRQLRARGLRRIFVEGGGVTVSHFFEAGVLDRVHITISPFFLGQGRPGLVMRKIDRLDQAVRPCVRRFMLGEDTLFDCRF
jgi:diaminohydroxyphosphoribosylaminopyrimidine deaminase / 5-amino-6-(5-phosphoribosylamino)uracil reductase